MKKLSPILALFALTACFGDKDEETGDTTAETGETAVEVVDCADRDPSACEDSTGLCAVISGKPLTLVSEGEYCLDWDDPMEALGCMEADGGCGDAETLAIKDGTDGTCSWWLPNTCIPTGYTYCEGWADECAP